MQLRKTFTFFLVTLLFWQFAQAQAGYSTVAKRVEDWFALNAGSSQLKGAKLNAITATGKNGEPIKGLELVFSDGKKRMLIEGAGKNVKKKEWEEFKKALTYKQQSKEAILRGLKGKDVLLRLGPETLSFLVALGAIQYTKMILDPSMSPLGLYQQIESQAHPITHISFGAFMYVSGVVSPVLQSLLKPGSGLTHYVRYLGMSAGMIASDMVHEVDQVLGGKLTHCVADLELQVKNFESISANCERAFESWSDYSLDTLAGLFPSIVSLISATIIAANVERHLVHKGLARIGLEILFKPLIPGQQIFMGLRFARWVVHTAGNILPFTVAQELLGRPIETSMSTFSQSANFGHWQSDLMSDLVKAKSDNWSEESSQAVLERLMKFTKEFKAWRKLQLRTVEESYSSWLAKISEFSSSYNLSEYVYRSFVEKASPRTKKDAFVTLMRRPAPLFGITQKSNSQGQIEYLISNPSIVMENQLATIVEVTEGWNEETLRQRMNATQWSKYEKEIQQSLELARKLNLLAKQALSQTSINSVNEFFATTHQIGLLFEQLNKTLGLRNFNPGLFPGAYDSRSRVSTESREYGFWMRFRSLFGNPFPIFQRGGLFFAALEEQPIVQSNSVALPAIERVGGLSGLKAAQATFLKMFFGPDLGRKNDIFVPQNGIIPFVDLGFGISKMNPPRITRVEPKLDIHYEKDMRKWDPRLLYTFMNTKVSSNGKTYHNFYDYVLDNWDSLFAINDAEEFEKMWNDNVRAPYAESWDQLEIHYQKFVEKFFNIIRRSDRSATNTGSLHNGTLKQIMMEMKMHALIAGEVLRSSRIRATEFAEPKAIMALPESKQPERNFDPVWGYRDTKPERLPLLHSLDTNTNLVLADHYLQHPNAKKNPLPWIESKPGQNLKLQNQILADFHSLSEMLAKIQFENKNNNVKIVSTLKNSDIIKIREDLSNRYEQLISHNGLTPLSGNRKKVFEISLRALKLLANEVINYALIANQLSFERSEGLPGQSGEINPECITTTGPSQMGAKGVTARNQKKCIEAPK